MSQPHNPLTCATCEALNELLVAIRTVNQLHNLGDAIYQVRERAATGQEGQDNPGVDSWDLPSVKAYSEACRVIREALS